MSKNQLRKLKLNKSGQEVNFFNKQKVLYYSGFCLTDNNKFAFFDINDQFVVDNDIKLKLNRFTLNEIELDLEIDREKQILPSKGIKKVNLGIGFVFRDLFDIFMKTYPECVFYPLLTFFGKKVNTLLIVLSEEYGKPVGLLKTHQ